MYKMYKLQYVLFDRNKHSLDDALSFLKTHHLKSPKVDLTTHMFRFRQLNPKYLERQGYSQFRTKQITDGIYFVIGYKE